jgi:hypothetical protein
MEKFRKNQKGLFICEECEKLYIKKDGLSKHINIAHSSVKNYYDKWLKEENENKCKICNNQTEFISLRGYKNTCSKKCGDIYTWEKVKESNMKKYGVEHQLDRKEIRKKSRITMKEKYGGETSAQSKILLSKMQDTMLNKYGVKFAAQNEKLLKKQQLTKKKKYANGAYDKEKFIQTNLKRYGVEYPQQNKEIFQKSKQSLFITSEYKNTKLTYQGSYELDFLEKFFKEIDIKNGLSMNYFFKGENHVYHSDFYIPSRNLIIEIKNSYLYEKDKSKIKVKEKTVKNLGYDYIIIIDKNYNEFSKVVLKKGA